METTTQRRNLSAGVLADLQEKYLVKVLFPNIEYRVMTDVTLSPDMTTVVMAQLITLKTIFFLKVRYDMELVMIYLQWTLHPRLVQHHAAKAQIMLERHHLELMSNSRYH